MEDWSLIYKLSFVLTVIFHPDFTIRKFSFYLLIWWYLLGNIANCCEANLGYLTQTYYEFGVILLTYLFIKGKYVRYIIVGQSLILLLLNIHQYLGWYEGSIFYSSFLSTQDYIYWNKWGFELMLFALWFNQEIFSCIKKRWTPNNVIMAYTIGWVVFLSGNY